MKKNLFILFALVMGAAMTITSCKKDEETTGQEVDYVGTYSAVETCGGAVASFTGSVAAGAIDEILITHFSDVDGASFFTHAVSATIDADGEVLTIASQSPDGVVGGVDYKVAGTGAITEASNKKVLTLDYTITRDSAGVTQTLDCTAVWAQN